MTAYIYNRRFAKVILPAADILQAGDSVAALGGVDAGGNLLRDGGVDGIVDENNIDGGGVGAIMG